MVKRLYVGNIPYDRCNDEGLRELFDGLSVESTHIVVDKELQRPRGFCFVEMSNPDAAKLAIERVAGVLFHGRVITVREAHDKQQNKRDERRARH